MIFGGEVPEVPYLYAARDSGNGGTMQQADIAIIGGGIVGVATAYTITQRYPRARVVILEKEHALAAHQTGNNSGVLHSGIYYRPGSLKAANCRSGKEAMESFCEREGIPFDRCGKVIVATTAEEIPALDRIYERGQANGIVCSMISADRLTELEPHAAGVRAIHVPEAGIVDYRRVTERMAARVEEGGGEVLLGAKVTGMRHVGGGVILESTRGEVQARVAVNCAGLYSDKVTALSGMRPEVMILPFRGEYYELLPEARRLCRGLIYPVPDPNFPFLGVHFTRMIGGGVECGPNAVMSFAREGYTMTQINLPELLEILRYPGFHRIAMRHWRTELHEIYRSLSKAAFVRTLQKLVPEVQAGDLEPAPAGVRAQAVAPDGTLVDDFVIEQTAHVINVCNAPSPAATASLNVARLIVDNLWSREGFTDPVLDPTP